MKKGKENNQLYADGFVLSVPKKNLKAYKKMALEGGRVWKKYGALDYKECVIDDAEPSMGEHEVMNMNFLELAKPKKGETVVFSYIVYKSRKHRDEVNTKVMKEMEEYVKKHPKAMKMPFDMKRMAYGGFKTLVSM